MELSSRQTLRWPGRLESSNTTKWDPITPEWSATASALPMLPSPLKVGGHDLSGHQREAAATASLVD